MTEKCIDIEKIAEILALPDDDPRRRHLEECPRCSSILLSFQAFLEAEGVPGSDAADAEARLSAFIRANIEKATPDTSMTQPAPERPGFLSEFIQGLFRRPVWVAAVLVIVAAGMLWWQPWVQDQPVLRGTTPAGTGSPLDLKVPQVLEDGSLRLAWIPLDGADAYEVRLYDEGLSEIARFQLDVPDVLPPPPDIFPGHGGRGPCRKSCSLPHRDLHRIGRQHFVCTCRRIKNGKGNRRNLHLPWYSGN